jgi:hypothetical protein
MNKTCSPGNQFTFTCPIFKANTKIAPCLELRDRVYRGEPPAVRLGCQTAIHANKCPIPTIITHMCRMKDDPYHSDEPKMGSLRQNILDVISPVLIPEKMIEASGASDAEKAAMRKRNDEARAGAKLATPPRSSIAKPKETLPDPTPAPKINSSAAATGDLSAAINTEAVS